MSYKVLHEDDNLFHVKHPDGSTFKVAKKGLSATLTEKIKGYADGGKVAPFKVEINDPSLVQGTPQTTMGTSPTGFGLNPQVASADFSVPPGGQAPPSVPTTAQVDPNFASAVEGLGSAQPAVNAAIAQKDQQAPSPEQVQSASNSQQSGNFLTQNLALQSSGIKDLAKAQAQQFEEQAKYQNDYQKALEAQKIATDKAIAANTAENEALKSSITSGKIDPTRLWSSASTGNKILSGIALILGGAGGGMGHTSNSALETLNKAIDRDIDAQKAELGKKENLLSQNMQKYGDIQAADAATRMQLNSIVQAQIGMAAAKSGSAQAMANMKILIAEAQKQQIPLQMQFAQMVGKGMSQQVGGIPANSAIDQQRILLDPEYTKSRVVLNDRVYQASSPEEAQKLRAMESVIGPIMKDVRLLSELAKDPTVTVQGMPAYERATGIIGALSTALPRMTGLTSLNQEDIKTQIEQLQDPRKLSSFFGGEGKNKDFFNRLSEEVESKRQSLLTNYQGMGKIQGRSEGFR